MELTTIEWAVMWRAGELTDNWNRQGYVGLCSPHHFRDLIPNDRKARQVLNSLVSCGLMEHARHGRYRCWKLVV